MGNPLKKISAYLKALPSQEYAVSEQIVGIINYLLDSYLAKLTEVNTRDRNGMPDDPKIHVKELWLGCEIHKAVSVNRTYPLFAKAKNAWAFHKLFDDGFYKSAPFLDTYEWKNAVKGSYEHRVQQESLQIDQDAHATLPIFGTFFVSDIFGAKFIVHIDFGYEVSACVVSVMASPASQKVAEKFLSDLDRSIEQNDIYFKKCLSFLQGFLGFAKICKSGWEDIILKENVIQEIRDNSIGVIDNMGKLASLGMVPNRNVILISPPGMAKTTIFRAISQEVSHVTRIWCTGKSIKDSSDVTSLFEAARSLAPCIIFIEDMDLFGKDRSTLSGYESHILNEFLACLDGTQENSGVVIMASTNDIKSMDEALIDRPGRFDVKVMMPYPDAIDRSKMMTTFLKRIHAFPDESVTKDTLKNVIELTDGLTGAYIKDLAKATVIKAVSRGNFVDCGVLFNADDLTGAAEQVVRNYQIGKSAKKNCV
jgi:ATP-dependent 26S proteasome regulatory subunit